MTNRTYRYTLHKTDEEARVTVKADNYAGAEAKLLELGYSLKIGEWIIKRLAIEPGGK